MIRPATPGDLSRIAEILVFVKRARFYPIFRNDAWYFGELQVLSVAKEYEALLDGIWVYDDGVVKGLIRVEGDEIVELYVDAFFQNQGIGGALLEHAKRNFPVTWLWALEKNVDALRFYRAHGFVPSGVRKLEEDTPETLVKLIRA